MEQWPRDNETNIVDESVRAMGGVPLGSSWFRRGADAWVESKGVKVEVTRLVAHFPYHPPTLPARRPRTRPILPALCSSTSRGPHISRRKFLWRNQA